MIKSGSLPTRVTQFSTTLLHLIFINHSDIVKNFRTMKRRSGCRHKLLFSDISVYAQTTKIHPRLYLDVIYYINNIDHEVEVIIELNYLKLTFKTLIVVKHGRPLEKNVCKQKTLSIPDNLLDS